MTPRQKLSIEQSEKRQRISELLALDERTDEHRAELGRLTKRMQEIEPELRAAIVAEGDDEARAAGMFGTGDGEAGERGRLMREIRVADYLAPAAAGGGLQGRAAELNAAFEVPVAGPGGGVIIPWAMLAPPVEPRQAEQRAFTTTGAYAGGVMQRPIMQRLFGPGIMDALGVRMDTVPVGRSEWPLITAGVAPTMKVEGAAADAAVTATFNVETLKPKRLTGTYEFTHEMAAQVPDLEQNLRRDLAEAVQAKMNELILTGDETTNSQEPDGFLTKLSAPTVGGTVSSYADYAGAHSVAVDGIHASMETEVSSVIGVASYQAAAKVFNQGSGESGSEALKRRSRSCMASTYIPVPDDGSQDGAIFHAGGPNGGAMRGDSIAAVWPTLEIIRDIYSQASQGVKLTWVTLWDAETAFRAAAYQRIGFRVAVAGG